MSKEDPQKHKARSQNYYIRTRDNPDRKAVRKACTKAWYVKNKKRILQEKKEWRQRMLGSLEYRFKRAIQTAKQRNIMFSLTFEQFIDVADQPCYYCGTKLCSQVMEGSGLDRIDSSKGYEVDNILPCGARCNKIKMDDLTVEETKAAVEAILKVRENQ